MHSLPLMPNTTYGGRPELGGGGVVEGGNCSIVLLWDVVRCCGSYFGKGERQLLWRLLKCK